MRMTVIGCGYLGAVHAASMAELGHDVVGVDVDEAKIAALASGLPPFFEPGLPELLDRALATGRLRFTTDMSEARGNAVHFVAVGTPQQPGALAADLRYVHAAVDALAPMLTPGDIVVGKSTVPVGTARALGARLEGTGAVVAWNPEFLREGFAIEDTLHPDRLVYGLPDDPLAAETVRVTLDEVYAATIADGTPVVATDLETAELVKSAANAFLATKISFINAMAEVCEAAGADVTQLADAIGHDARIGRRFLNAGLGFGGGCLPKDIRAFMARAGELGADQALTFLREVDQINMRRRSRAVDLAREVLGGSVLGRKIAVLGLAFKPDSDDVRDSPALNVAAQLSLQGAAVLCHDPRAIENSRHRFPELSYVETVAEAVRDADAVMVLTEWGEYRELDPVLLAEQVAQPIVIDGRNCLDSAAWRAAGWRYRALGRPREALAPAFA
jgi:UDPglucose 6-dehydrogenase